LNQQPDIFSLGDGALTIDLGNRISDTLNSKVLAMQQWLQEHPFDGLLDTIPAYSSLTIVYDPFLIRNTHQPVTTVFDWVQEKVLDAFDQSGQQAAGTPVRHRIPVCYEAEFGPDLSSLASQKQLEPAEVVQLHMTRIYRIHMIGFLPGFSYMAEVDERIALNRKNSPVLVHAGSVGIAGSQTGIYPFTCPGGWNIIGRTPLKMFNALVRNPVLLKAGDEVEFYGISKAEWPGS
jgi:inhibitor of KinA